MKPPLPDDKPFKAAPARHPAWRIAAWAALALGLAAAAATAFVLKVLPTAPGIEELKALQAERPSVLLTADGQPLSAFKRAQQERVPLSRISPHTTKALLVTEDQRFFEHRGVDLRRTAVALVRTLTGRIEGGSTITQQLARNLFPEQIGRARTPARKLREIITALRIERAYTKQEILENYLNSAPFLYNVVGIEMAARTYFDKSAADLDVLESATLVGMLKGTTYYNPVLNPERAQVRRNLVLAQMVKHQLLAESRYRTLRDLPLQVQLKRQPELLGPAPHFAVTLRKWLIGWADEHGYNLYTDGLVVHTTIDSRLQAAALRAVATQAQALQAVADVEWSAARLQLVSQSTKAYERQQAKVDPFAHFWKKRRDVVAQFVRESPEFKAAVKRDGSEKAALARLMTDPALAVRLKQDKTRLEAGFVAIDPASGEVKAWVGSRGFDVDQYDHVAQAERQPGSTFKPFVYAAALEGGLTPNHSYVDFPIEVAMHDGTVWRPTDMAEPSGELLSLRDGLALSKNTITTQLALDIGIPRVVSVAAAMGVDEAKLDPVPSLALGTSPVTLLEMTSAYATIAAEGRHRKPIFVTRITDRHGAVLAEFAAQTRRALSPDSAADLIDMMRGVVQRGTGTQIKSRFGVAGDVAGKTGTSQHNADGWFILMHPKLVAGAWVGFNDQRVTMRSNHWGQGGHNAILLVGDFFRSAQKAGLVDKKSKFPPPRHPAPPPPPPLPEGFEPWAMEITLQVDPPGATAPTEIIVRQEDGTLVIGDKASVTTSRPADEPPKSAAELERMLPGAPALRSGETWRNELR
ncbi:penicillin-binding protein 1A [Piscinibacter sp.]|uniref:penicillin-binding protein 1A n=1 Tax=Piscinibacter sp. TaxID=1903157 RepID=UPI002D0C5CB9|nr:transglycosylase domain-containing protein [Albitalea sp.]HUG25523.1 transglycosylase domain-containing protein [Albitalea sp.]